MRAVHGLIEGRVDGGVDGHVAGRVEGHVNGDLDGSADRRELVLERQVLRGVLEWRVGRSNLELGGLGLLHVIDDLDGLVEDGVRGRHVRPSCV